MPRCPRLRELRQQQCNKRGCRCRVLSHRYRAFLHVFEHRVQVGYAPEVDPKRVAQPAFKSPRETVNFFEGFGVPTSRPGGAVRGYRDRVAPIQYLRLAPRLLHWSHRLEPSRGSIRIDDVLDVQFGPPTLTRLARRSADEPTRRS